jgi:hypothetical protein
MWPEVNNICALCKKISFATLPFEDEPGIPHQTSLSVLKDSAKSCALCNLILEACTQVRGEVDDEHRGVTKARWIVSHPGAVLHSGKRIYGQLLGGIYAPGLNFGIEPVENQKPQKPSYSFADDLSVRPWLFGNWWKPRSPEGPSQLMGLGVRLAATPNIEDAEGNGEEIEVNQRHGLRVHFNGTYLRFRTEDGMCQNGSHGTT